MNKIEREYLIDNPEIKQRLIDHIFTSIPHTRALGVELISLERNIATGRVPYSENLVGNIENGSIHTGVLISLIDTIAGLAVFCALPKVEEITTLDLRLDSFKPSSPKKEIYAQAECYYLSNTIAFVRGRLFYANSNDVIAGCVATFFRTGNLIKNFNVAGRW